MPWDHSRPQTGEVISAPLWPRAFILPPGLCFYYFIVAGARTFEVDADDDLGSGVAQASLSSTLGTVLLGYRADVSSWNAIAGAALMGGALLLYGWARRTIAGRHFHIARSGDVTEVVCEAGPYRHIRHPLYTSYALAFAAMLAALPSSWTPAIFVLDAALFVHAARNDERSIAASELAADYLRYRQRVDMFFPRLRRRAVG